MAQTREHPGDPAVDRKADADRGADQNGPRGGRRGWRRFRLRSSRPLGELGFDAVAFLSHRGGGKHRYCGTAQPSAAACGAPPPAAAAVSPRRWIALLPSKARGWWSPGRRSPAKYGSGIPCGLPASTRRCASAACMPRIKRLSRRTPDSALR